MAKVEYSFPVDKIHCKIAKDHKVGFAHRTASKLNYTTTYGKRTTPVTQAETQWRSMFAQISSATHERMADTEQMKVDQLAFREQTKYKTLYQFVWNEVRKDLESQE